MKLISRLFIAFTIALFAASPAMACCIIGHDIVIESKKEIVQTCHDEMSEYNEGQENTCPDCVDLDPILIQANTNLEIAIPSKHVDLKVGFASVADNSGYKLPRSIETTGPPKASPIRHLSPVVYKQLLLI